MCMFLVLVFVEFFCVWGGGIARKKFLDFGLWERVAREKMSSCADFEYWSLTWVT